MLSVEPGRALISPPWDHDPSQNQESDTEPMAPTWCPNLISDFQWHDFTLIFCYESAFSFPDVAVAVASIREGDLLSSSTLRCSSGFLRGKFNECERFLPVLSVYLSGAAHPHEALFHPTVFNTHICTTVWFKIFFFVISSSAMGFNFVISKQVCAFSYLPVISF